MNTKDLILNIAVNMGRLGRWTIEGKKGRIKQFILDTQNYIDQLDKRSQSERFRPTYISFKRKFNELKNKEPNEIWAEDALTWANILTHRAKLA
jgi:hypothetical protein